MFLQYFVIFAPSPLFNLKAILFSSRTSQFLLFCLSLRTLIFRVLSCFLSSEIFFDFPSQSDLPIPPDFTVPPGSSSHPPETTLFALLILQLPHQSEEKNALHTSPTWKHDLVLGDM